MIQLIFALSFAAVFFRRAKLENKHPLLWATVGATVFLAASTVFYLLSKILFILGELNISISEIAAMTVGTILGSGFTRWSMRRLFRSLYTKQIPFAHGFAEPTAVIGTNEINTVDNDNEGWFSKISRALPGVQIQSAAGLSNQVLRRLEIATSTLALTALMALLILSLGTSTAQVLAAIFLMGVLLFGTGIPPWRLVEILYRPAHNRARQREIDANALCDKRRPVLLLRSFSTENERVPREEAEVRVGFASTFLGHRFEQILVRQMRYIGPVVAIGDPSNRSTAGGATRLYTATEDWKRLVSVLMEEAQLIILQLSPTLNPSTALQIKGTILTVPPFTEYLLSDGFRYELFAIVSGRHVRKTAIVNIDKGGSIIPQERLRVMLSDAPTEIFESYGLKNYDCRIYSPAIGSFGGNLANTRPQDDMENAFALFVWRWHKTNQGAKGHVEQEPIERRDA